MTRNALLLCLVTLGLLAAQSRAGVIATNGDVPNTMDDDTGTAADPSIYQWTAYTGTKDGFSIGVTYEYNEFHVVNGSSYSGSNYSQKVIGNGADHSAVLVDASTWTTTGGQVWIGNAADYNTLEFANGAEGTSSDIYLGYDNGATAGGSYNAIIVDGSDTTLTFPRYRLRIGYYGGSYNTVTISNGGTLYGYNDTGGGREVEIGYSGAAANNDITVTGFGSTFDVLRVYLGSDVAGSADNTLTVVDSALAKISDDGFTFKDTGGDNYVRLGAGFVAVEGNDTSALVDGDVKVWNGSAYVVGTKGTDWTATYYDNDTDAFNATGYNGLGGYTIFTGGLNPVPEPACLSVIVAGAALLVRRRRR